MDILEYFYEYGFSKIKFKPRNIQLPKSNKTLLWGIKYSGKFSFIQSFNTKDTLLIDLDDLRVDITFLKANLRQFITSKKIQNLILYGYDFQLPLPNTPTTILICHKNIDIQGFEKVFLPLLNFKESIHFEKRNYDLPTLFNLYLQNGNYPELYQIPEYKKLKRAQEIYALTYKEDLDILKTLALYQSHSISVYFLFNRVKEHKKISKDRFYALFEQFLEDRHLYIVEKLGAKRAAKKLYFPSFLVKSHLCSQKEFPKMFENMIFLEIKDEELFYIEPIGFYLPKKDRILVPIPFGNEVRIEQRVAQILKKNALEPKAIEVITVNNSFLFEINNIPCIVKPFYEWAL